MTFIVVVFSVVFLVGTMFIGYVILDTFFYPPDNRDDKDDAPWNQ